VTSPQVSVVLPVYNGAADLAPAIDSILQQSFVDFELIAIDDGSTDGSAAILDGLRDPRVRIVHQENRGLAAALNRGIALARGEYIARQDQDDLALPPRLARQVAFLKADPACALVGTRAEIRVGDREPERFHDHPADDAALRFELLFDSPFVHSSVMMRKSAVQAVGGYSTDPARQPPEDYELWSRLARGHRLANLRERLTIYRETPAGMSRGPGRAFVERAVMISAENLAAALGEPVPGRLHRDIAALSRGAFDLLSGNPDVGEMCRAVELAGARIHAAAPESNVPDRAANRIEVLRRQYARSRYRKILGPVWPAAVLGWRYCRIRLFRRRVKQHGSRAG
jgi:glycosyltransferase involved in cell wall biosynthesis